MGNNALIHTPILCKDDPIRPGAPTRIHLIRAQDRELLVGSGIVEAEALVVVVDVRVVVGGGAGVEVGAALGDGVVDVGLVVAGVAAGVDA